MPVYGVPDPSVYTHMELADLLPQRHITVRQHTQYLDLAALGAPYMVMAES